MVFESLAEKLGATFKKLRGRGKLSESDVDAALKEVRMALLEADVNYRVVKDFVAKVRERAVGQEVMKSLSPGHQVIKIVHEEMVGLMGGKAASLETASRPPTVIMLVGLQGSGKTTSAGKLALHLRKRGRRPLLAAADPYRPAAGQQLEVLGRQVDLPVYNPGAGADPVDTSRQAVAEAGRKGCDVVILDTAGRLHIDEDLMGELGRIKATATPSEILLVVDAMTGQDAVRVAESFEERLGLSGVILTKIDGDARGGAALSVRAVTGKPIKFVGTGEKLEALEPFHPDRMASRILGMGDVMTLIEKAQEAAEADQVREFERQLRTGELTLEDFLDQLRQVKKMGSLEDLIGMIPGLGKFRRQGDLRVEDKEFRRLEAIINSMTPEERRSPDLLGSSRKRRVARGSGTTVQDVNRLLKQFEQTRKMIKQLTGRGKKAFKGPGPGPGLFPFR